MSFEEQLAALGGEDLLNFLLKDDIPCPEILGEDSTLLEDYSMPEPMLLDKEVDDLITSILNPSEDEPDGLQGCLFADSDSGISEDQHLFCTPGSSDFTDSPQISDIVQVDHNYSLHLDMPVLESMRSNVAERDASTEPGTWLGLEGTSITQGQSPSFPIAVVVDAGAQVGPTATVQSSFMELILREEERQVLEKDEEQPLKKEHWKQSAQESHCVEICIDSLENRSLLEQLQGLQVLVTQSTTRTSTAKSSTRVIVLSFNVIVPSSSCSFQSREIEPELGMLSQQIFNFPNQEAPDMQENTVLQWLRPEPGELFLLVSLSQSQEEEQSSPCPDPRSFSNSSSSGLQAVAGSELGPPQPQEQVLPEQPFADSSAGGMESPEEAQVGGMCCQRALCTQQYHADEM